MKSCPQCGAERGLKRWPDGSSVRNVRRERAQAVCIVIRDAHEAQDELMALQAWEDIACEAEADYVHGWLSSRQKAWLKNALHTSRLAAGWTE